MLTVDIRVYCVPELKRLAGEKADEMDVPLSELGAIALAEYLDRPDLAHVPRRAAGRRRKPIPPPLPA